MAVQVAPCNTEHCGWSEIRLASFWQVFFVVLGMVTQGEWFLKVFGVVFVWWGSGFCMV